MIIHSYHYTRTGNKRNEWWCWSNNILIRDSLKWVGRWLVDGLVDDEISAPKGSQVGGQAGGQVGDLTERQLEAFNIILSNLKISRKLLSEKLGINESAVQKHLDA